MSSGVARAFPGGRLTHPEGQIEDKKEEFLRKNKKKWWKIRKVQLLPTRGCEAGSAPADERIFWFLKQIDIILIIILSCQ